MRSLLRTAGWGAGERRRLALAIALAAGAAGAAIALLATSGYLISRAAQRPEILTLMIAIVGVRAFGLVRAVLRYCERLVSHDLALRQLARLRRRFFAALVPLAPAAPRASSGDLLSRFVADVDALKDLQLRVLIPGAVAACVVAGASVAGWLILPAAGLVLLGSLTALAIVLPLSSAVVSARCARRQSPARAALTSQLVEAIDGSAELALAGRAREFEARLRGSDALLGRLARGDALMSALVAFLGQALAGGVLLALLILAVGAVHSGALSGVLLAALVFLALAALESVLALPAAGRSLRICQASGARLAELAPAAPHGWDSAPAPAPAPAVGEAGGPLALQQVSFRYGPEEPWVLEDAQLELGEGEHVALTGPSGAGKSTVGELLVGFREPTAGGVSLGGVALADLEGRELRRRVLLCAQDAHVFNTSIRENLLLARRQARERELWRALETVELSSWAAALPQGLDTIAGQGGERLSGGQRTRLALARALLSDARFLILDEPTAHLQAPLARRLMRRLACERGRRCVLVITHDLSALEGFDRVLELRGGQIRAASPAAVPAPLAPAEHASRARDGAPVA